MKNNKNENKFFIEACNRAGIKVRAKEDFNVAEGLLIVDGRGYRYTVNADGKIKKVSDVGINRAEFGRKARIRRRRGAQSIRTLKNEKIKLAKTAVGKVD